LPVAVAVDLVATILIQLHLFVTAKRPLPDQVEVVVAEMVEFVQIPQLAEQQILAEAEAEAVITM
jgi:hypothetical protein